jgi:hypothetical protein
MNKLKSQFAEFAYGFDQFASWTAIHLASTLVILQEPES